MRAGEEQPGHEHREQLVFEIDPETGIGRWRPERSWRESIWAAPFVGLAELVSDLRHKRLTSAEWLFLLVLAAIIINGLR